MPIEDRPNVWLIFRVDREDENSPTEETFVAAYSTKEIAYEQRDKLQHDWGTGQDDGEDEYPSVNYVAKQVAIGDIISREDSSIDQNIRSHLVTAARSRYEYVSMEGGLEIEIDNTALIEADGDYYWVEARVKVHKNI